MTSSSRTPAVELSIVVPVYRSEKILPRLVEEVSTAVHGIGIGDSFELVLVNDCSPDRSWLAIKDLAQKHGFVKGINLRRNFGQHNATMAGLNNVSGKFVVIMDDDLQHPPSAIGEMLRALQSGFDVCYTHYLNRRHEAWKKLGSSFNDKVATVLLDKPRGLYLSSFKALRREVVDEIVKYDGPYAYVDGLILGVTSSITSVDVEHQERHEGQGNYNLRRSVSLWLKMATSFSILPLRLASLVGMGLAVLSLVMIAVVVVLKIRHPDIAVGWASIISVLLLIGGVQTMCIGMIGEYLGRSYLKLNRKPQFVVAEKTGERVGHG
ncbi:glycosyltransferase family 2 protein [Cupriavidus sp.]|uniref:glycosyltransferase family 2 protein n=1 Tax=Cupriavidus sp. TaxID=1873897 RepID=UPI0028BEAEAB|nr:glycosyltransferase family 2 protein [Cupriavidus sp.]